MKRFLLFIFCLAYIISTNAINGPIPYFTYTHLYGNTWQVRLHLYNNCNYYTTSSAAAAYASYDTCNYQSKNVRLIFRKDTLPDGTSQHNNVYRRYCPNTLTMCDSPFNATGLASWRNVVYTDTITLPEACGMWKFSLGAISSANFRDPMITNIAPSTYTYYGEAILNADSLNPNTSALWLRPFVAYACEGQSTQWYLPTYDADGDSLVFSLVPPRERDSKWPNPLDTLINDIPYIAPYSLAEPFGTNGTWQFDPNIPCVRFTATPNQIALITFRIDEYRNGTFMGATFKDHLYITTPCSYTVPQRTIDFANVQNIQFGVNDTVVVYTNQAMKLSHKHFSNQSNAKLRMESNVLATLPSGASYSLVQNTSDSIYSTLQWTPTSADTGIYFLHTMLEDTSCNNAEPIVPQDYFQIIQVKYKPTAVSDLKMNATSIELFPNPTPSGSSITIRRFGSLTKDATLELFEIDGKRVKSISLQHQNEQTISIQELHTGMYFYRYSIPEKPMETGKLIVK